MRVSWLAKLGHVSQTSLIFYDVLHIMNTNQNRIKPARTSGGFPGPTAVVSMAIANWMANTAYVYSMTYDAGHSSMRIHTQLTKTTVKCTISIHNRIRRLLIATVINIYRLLPLNVVPDMTARTTKLRGHALAIFVPSTVQYKHHHQMQRIIKQ